ncbi:MAG TPA: adenylate/guanylate cyclase domain-containing protein [Baekduia sp.]|nr:adenylate/guanylate cyclase domain-containing protein [Baekduia sp.]
MSSPPATRFARSGATRVAYQVFGEGPVDLVMVGGPASHLDLQWDEPATARTFERYASFARVVRFDRRGTGLSDPSDGPPTLEQQMDDLRAVMDAAGLRRAALLGAAEAGCAALFAATYPDRVTALVLVNVAAAGSQALTEARRQEFLDIIENHWGEGRFLDLFAPSRAQDPRFAAWWARFERNCASPSMARALRDLFMRTDLRGVLPSVRVPALVLHRTDNPLLPVEVGREVAALIPGARLVELPGSGDLYALADPDSPVCEQTELFLTGRSGSLLADRVLATVLFTDIVGSTDHATRLGDRSWRDLLDRHNAVVRTELERWRGREVKTLGDGFMAAFDGPARAVRAARAIIDACDGLGVQVRAGVHTGECELVGDDLAGVAVHVAARIAALATAGEVLVSGTVKERVVGSELRFADRGEHRLRGVPEPWRVHAVVA